MKKLTKSVVVYKKGAAERIIVLRLPAGTRVRKTIIDWEKNRSDQAVVLAVTNTKGDKYFESAKPYMTSHRADFEYRIGKTVKPEYPFDTGPGQCSSGIHFYGSRQAAVNHS